MRKSITTFIACACSLWAAASTYNIAPQARITASAETEAEPATNVNDGIVRVKGKGSWNCGNGVVFPARATESLRFEVAYGAVERGPTGRTSQTCRTGPT